jgi:hypothetical protein
MARLVYLCQVSCGYLSWKQNYTKQYVQLCLYKPWRRVGRRCISPKCCNLTLDGSGQLHPFVALAAVPQHYDIGWAVQPVQFMQKTEILPIRRIEPKVLGCTARSLVTVLTALFKLPDYYKTWRIYWFCLSVIPFWHQSVLTWVTS